MYTKNLLARIKPFNELGNIRATASEIDSYTTTGSSGVTTQAVRDTIDQTTFYSPTEQGQSDRVQTVFNNVVSAGKQSNVSPIEIKKAFSSLNVSDGKLLDMFKTATNTHTPSIKKSVGGEGDSIGYGVGSYSGGRSVGEVFKQNMPLMIGAGVAFVLLGGLKLTKKRRRR